MNCKFWLGLYYNALYCYGISKFVLQSYSLECQFEKNDVGIQYYNRELVILHEDIM